MAPSVRPSCLTLGKPLHFVQILGGGYKATCETDATCNLYVVLVLYKVKAEGDGIWETKCS